MAAKRSSDILGGLDLSTTICRSKSRRKKETIKATQSQTVNKDNQESERYNKPGLDTTTTIEGNCSPRDSNERCICDPNPNVVTKIE